MKFILRIIVGFTALVLFCAFALLCQWFLPHAPEWMQQATSDGSVRSYSPGPFAAIFAINVGIGVISISLLIAIDELK